MDVLLSAQTTVSLQGDNTTWGEGKVVFKEHDNAAPIISTLDWQESYVLQAVELLNGVLPVGGC